VGLHVAVEEPRAGELDVVAEGDPGGVAFRGGRGVAVTVWMYMLAKVVLVDGIVWETHR
jgi:hypothetical protein